MQRDVGWQKYRSLLDEVKMDMRQIPDSLKQPFDNSRPCPIESDEASWVKTAFADATHDLPGELDKDTNEQYLLSGTPKETVFKILANGMNERFSGDNLGSLFGEGVYFAEDGAKCDQYTRAPDNMLARGGTAAAGMNDLHTVLYPGGEDGGEDGENYPRTGVHYVFLCRVILGCSVRTLDGWTSIDRNTIEGFSSKNALTKEPGGLWATKVQRELGEIMGAHRPMPYHSLVAELGWKISRFREYIVFNGARVYPEYLLAYSREYVRDISVKTAWDTGMVVG